MSSGYFVNDTIKYDGVMYKKGQEFPDAPQSVIDGLRIAGALKTPTEVMPAKTVQDLLTERDQEIERLNAEIIKLKDELALARGANKRKSGEG